MWQIPCKMTNSSSKPLQTLGKWYQPRNPKKIPKPVQKKNPKTISHPILYSYIRIAGFWNIVSMYHRRMLFTTTLIPVTSRQFVQLPTATIHVLASHQSGDPSDPHPDKSFWHSFRHTSIIWNYFLAHTFRHSEKGIYAMTPYLASFLTYILTF